MRVLLLHPEWSRSCADCAKWLYDESGTVTKRAGLPVVRPPNVPTPCTSCAKIPHGENPVRENAIELTERNAAAYRHYLECRAVGEWPDDPIVRRTARICRSIHDEFDKVPLYRLIAAVMGMKRG